MSSDEDHNMPEDDMPQGNLNFVEEEMHTLPPLSLPDVVPQVIIPRGVAAIRASRRERINPIRRIFYYQHGVHIRLLPSYLRFPLDVDDINHRVTRHLLRGTTPNAPNAGHIPRRNRSREVPEGNQLREIPQRNPLREIPQGNNDTPEDAYDEPPRRRRRTTSPDGR